MYIWKENFIDSLVNELLIHIFSVATYNPKYVLQ